MKMSYKDKQIAIFGGILLAVSIIILINSLSVMLGLRSTTQAEVVYSITQDDEEKYIYKFKDSIFTEAGVYGIEKFSHKPTNGDKVGYIETIRYNSHILYNETPDLDFDSRLVVYNNKDAIVSTIISILILLISIALILVGFRKDLLKNEY